MITVKHYRMAGGMFARNTWYEEWQEWFPFRWEIRIFDRWFIFYNKKGTK